MNRSEVVDFLKAPFKERFVLACVLGLPVLLATPLIFSFFKFIFEHVETIQSLTDTETGKLLYGWFVSQDIFTFGTAFFGTLFSVILTSGFVYMLGHSIVEQRGEVFKFNPVFLTGSQIATGILKVISYTLWGFIFGFLCGAIMLFFPLLMLLFGDYIPSLFSVLLWIIIVLFEIAFVLWMILNIWIGGIRFLINLKTRVLFQFRENYHYLKRYKGRLVIAGLLCFVCGMIIQILMRTFYSWIVSASAFLQGLLLGLNVSRPSVVIILGLLVAVMVTMYLSLLQMTFTAKSIVWLEQKQSDDKAETVAHNIPVKTDTKRTPTKTAVRKTKAVANRKRK